MFIIFSIDKINNIIKNGINYTIIGNDDGDDLISVKNSNRVLNINEQYIIEEEYYSNQNDALNHTIYNFLLLKVISHKMDEYLTTNNKLTINTLLNYFNAQQLNKDKYE